MPRWRAILLWMLLGGILSTVTAWALAWFHRSEIAAPTRWVFFSDETIPDDATESDWLRSRGWKPPPATDHATYHAVSVRHSRLGWTRRDFFEAAQCLPGDDAQVYLASRPPPPIASRIRCGLPWRAWEFVETGGRPPAHRLHDLCPLQLLANASLHGVALWAIWTAPRTLCAACCRRGGRCRRCGYDLRATIAACPECGAHGEERAPEPTAD